MLSDSRKKLIDLVAPIFGADLVKTTLLISLCVTNALAIERQSVTTIKPLLIAALNHGEGGALFQDHGTH